VRLPEFDLAAIPRDERDRPLQPVKIVHMKLIKPDKPCNCADFVLVKRPAAGSKDKRLLRYRSAALPEPVPHRWVPSREDPASPTIPVVGAVSSPSGGGLPTCCC